MTIQIIAGDPGSKCIVEVSPRRWLILMKEHYGGFRAEMFDLAYPWVQVRCERDQYGGRTYYHSYAWSFSPQSLLVDPRGSAPPFFATSHDGSFCTSYLRFGDDVNQDPTKALLACVGRVITAGGRWSYAGGLVNLRSWAGLAQAAGIWPRRSDVIAMAHEVLTWWAAQDEFPVDTLALMPYENLAVSRAGNQYESRKKDTIALDKKPTILIP